MRDRATNAMPHKETCNYRYYLGLVVECVVGAPLAADLDVDEAGVDPGWHDARRDVGLHHPNRALPLPAPRHPPGHRGAASGGILEWGRSLMGVVERLMFLLTHTLSNVFFTATL